MQTIELDEASVIQGPAVIPQKKHNDFAQINSGRNSGVSGPKGFGQASQQDSFFHNDHINLDSPLNKNQAADDVSIMNMSSPPSALNPM